MSSASTWSWEPSGDGSHDPEGLTGTPEGLVCQDVAVSFGATVALSGVSLTVPAGQIVGLMGHNGAGKSTLLNVIAGATAPDQGVVTVGGAGVTRFGDPRHLSRLGVTAIHQEPALAPNLSIMDNLLLGRPAGRARRELRRIATSLLRDLDVDVDPSTPVAVLSLGERQVVDLARGMLGGRIKALLLDEPAAALGAVETAALHERVRTLSGDGTSVVYVSHRLPDILDVCHRIVVLREGRVVLDEPRAAFDAKSLANALAGQAAGDMEITPSRRGSELCTIRAQQGELTVHGGEVVGLFGIASGPQFDVLESLFSGGRSVDATLNGAPYAPKHPADAIARGVHLVPGDREQDGLIMSMSALENVFLPWNGDDCRRGRINTTGQREAYERIRATLDIRGPAGTAAISSFSGGNRQKHLVARWASVRPPRMLLLAQPTQGVDEAAKADIGRVVRSLAADGVAVLVASAEADELSSMCDRIYALTTHDMEEFTGRADLDERLLHFISGEHTTAR